MATLGEKIRTLRKNAGLTLDELALAIGASKSAVWELENKVKARPSAERINQLARVLKVTPEFLMNEKSDELPTESVADTAFFRRYQDLDGPTKQKLQEILEVLDRKEPKS
jgi:transcriptional regulator with XRE-family HTH domain